MPLKGWGKNGKSAVVKDCCLHPSTEEPAAKEFLHPILSLGHLFSVWGEEISGQSSTGG